jgi:ligand-binding sensor domain-containing protein
VHGDRAYVGTALGVAEIHDGRVGRTLAADVFASAVAVQGETLLVASVDETLARIPLAVRGSRGVRPIVQDTPGAITRFVQGAAADGPLYGVSADAVHVVDAAAAQRRLVGADPDQMSDRNVAALAVGDDGRLWVGYFDRGLDILDAAGRRTAHIENDRVFCVNRIVAAPRERMMAVATANGLVLFDTDGRQKQVLGRGDGLIANHVTDLRLDGGRFTLATPAGLTFIDKGGARSLHTFNGLVNRHVYALGVSGAQVVAGTLGGLSVFENGTVRASYTTANSALTHNWITAVARVGDDWFVGTYGGGVFVLDDKGHSRRTTDLEGAIEINPNAMAVTSTHVFAGTLSRGLLVYDRAAQRWRAHASGLPSLNVTALATAGDALYVGTDNGIVRVAVSAFQRP